MFLCTDIAFSQLSNERSIRLLPSTSQQQLDSLSVMPGSFNVVWKDVILDPSSYMLDEMHSTILFTDSTLVDSVDCHFRVFPVYFGNEEKNKERSLIMKNDVGNFTPYVIGRNENTGGVFSDQGLQKSGSISRGILFGNNQNLSVNSTLNLQLSGKLSEQYSILASVTDDNIPIQPDGNTQQLQDFDQVFIQIYDEKTKLIAGDFQLRRPTGYFLNYFKRAQGAYFLNTSNLSSKGKNSTKLTTEASASISKGRFARNVIQGVEGNQGPYRLRGADNELFIIVLAGTEQVYIDGRLLQRGQDKDYVIDYNASEIIFTPRQFITKDRRIVVEFQYSEKRYARPLLQTSLVLEHAQNKFFLNVFSENDAKNQPLQQDLSELEKAVLAASGDDFLSAYISGIDSTGYSNNAVLYALTDTLGFDSVFVFSNDSSLAHYRVSFTFVGSGNGDYVEDGFTSNGKRYAWIAPVLIDGVFKSQGNYAPIILLASPKKNQMLSTGADLLFGRKNQSRLLLEGAVSNKDLNTFSTRDASDDIGFAFRSKYNWKRETTLYQDSLIDGSKSKGRNELNAELDYEYTGKHFVQIERFREVEFARNWNVQAINLTNDQHISGGSFGIKTRTWGTLQAGADMFLLGNDYQGYKGKVLTNVSTKNKFSAQINASYLTTQGLVKSQFLRHKSNISKEFGKLRVYFKDEHEHNLFYLGKSDTLASTTYQFYDWEAGAGTADTLKRLMTVYYRDRIDRKPLDASLASAARADQYGATVGLRGKKESRLNINVSNRRLRVVNPELFTQSPENTLLTRIDYSFKLKNGFFANTTFYEIGSGLEQKKEFIYLEVPAGQGAYVWNDYDGDNIKDLNEFEIAQFGYEANYIRSSVQTNDYAKTYSNQFTQSFLLTPAKILKRDIGIQKFVARFSNNTTLRIDRRTTRENKDERFNPFILSIADSSLLALNGLFRNILFFNKSNPIFGLDYTYQYGRNKNLLSNGFESRGDDYNQMGLRWSFVPDFTFFMENRYGKKVASSDFLSGRNYELIYYSLQPKFTWQPGTQARLNLTAQYSEKQNRQGSELVIIQKLGTDLTYNTTEKGSFQMEINYINIRYNRANNNSLSFEMLEGLTAGNNFTWSAGVQRTVAKNLQVNLIYNGRKPEDIKTIHSGGLQVRALF
jgi:hypothetical protein